MGNCPSRSLDRDSSAGPADLSPPSFDYWAEAGGYALTNWPVTLSNALAWYELSAFSAMEPWIASAVFGGSRSAGWLAFGLTFAAQTCGGFVVGKFADRYGRQPALLGSLWAIFCSTVGQGLAPVHPVIGPAWIVLCRIGQGLGSGGQLAAVTVFSAESVPRELLGFSSFIVSAGITLGFALSTLVSLLLSQLLKPDQMASWGWRIPFLAGGVPTLVSIWTMSEVGESSEFEAQAQLKDMPDVGLLSEVDWRVAAIAVFGSLSGFVQQYFAGLYLQEWLVRHAGLAPPPASLALLAGYALQIALALPACAWADRTGLGKVNAVSCAAAAALSAPMYWLLLRCPGSPAVVVLCGVAVPGALQALTYVSNAWISELFPTEVRCTAVALYYNYSQMLAAFGPMVAELVATPLFPAWYSAVAGLASLAAVLWALRLHELHREGHGGLQVVHLRADPY